MIRRLAPVPLFLALLVTGVACGDEASKEDFKKDYEPVNREIVSIGGSLLTAIQGAERQTNKALAEQFRTLAGRLDDQRKKLDELEAPDDVDSERDKLSDAMSASVDDLEAIAAAGEKNDPPAARSATVSLLREHAPQLRDARQALARELGIQVEGEPGR